MQKPQHYLPLWVLLSLFVAQAQAQFNVVSGLPAQQVANALGGQGVTISNAVYGGGTLNTQVGIFTNVGSNVSFTDGVFLCSGIAAEFNNIPFNAQTGFTSFNGPFTPGDPDLDAITFPNPTNDAAILEFDFVANADSIFFDYIFASEEYNEYACSDFNDVFAFIISGPGFATPTNIALIPGTTTLVSINNVNNGTVGMFGDILNCTAPNGSLAYSSYFVDNTAGAFIEFDGLTTALTAKAQVVPCSTYHIKLAVADAFDSSFESGVFLRAGSFSSSILDVQALTANGDSIITEGCNTGMLSFALPAPVTSDYSIPFQILGTAINGTDYSLLDSTDFVVAAGDSTLDILINPLTDALNEGLESMLVVIQVSACEYDTIVFFINEEIVLGAPTVSCNVASPSSLNFSWSAVAGATGYEVSTDGGVTWIPANPGPLQHTFTGLGADSTISIEVRAIGGTPGCSANPVGQASCSTCIISLNTDNVDNVSCNGGNDASIAVSSSAGIAPFTFNWSDGNSFNSANPTFIYSGLTAGNYTVTVIEAGGCSNTLSITVTEPSAVVLNTDSTDILCNGDSTGTAIALASGGVGNFSYLWSNGATTDTITDLAEGVYSVIVADANGCEQTTSVTINSPAALGLQISLSNNPIDCDFIPDAAAQVIASGGAAPYDYLWSNGSIADVTTTLPAGDISCTVTDANGCTVSVSSTVTALQLALVDAFLVVAGQNQGNINAGEPTNIGVSSLPAGQTYQWIITPATGLSISNATAANTTITGDAAGNYVIVVTATSVDGCTATDTLWVEVFEGFNGMPDAFTPDGQGDNNLFRPVNLSAEFVQVFKIFNRFGQKVYDDPSLTNGGWDGTLNGQPQARDAYTYVLVYQRPTDLEPITLRGQVMLLR